MPTQDNSTKLDNRAPISRRRFLQNLTLVTAGALLAGCTPAPDRGDAAAISDATLVEVRVPQPQVDATRQEFAPELGDFLALSALLTGVDNLDPALGQTYLQSLQNNPELPMSVIALLDAAKAGQPTLPTTLEMLEGSGFFTNNAAREVADTITATWYTGVFVDNGTERVATFVDALAWKTLHFTKAMTVCGSYRFWTEPPESAID